MVTFGTCLVTQLSSRDLIIGLLDSKTQFISHHAALSLSGHIQWPWRGELGRGMASGLVMLHLYSTALLGAGEDVYFMARFCSHPSVGISIYWTSTECSGLGKKIQVSLLPPSTGKYLTLSNNLKTPN